MQEVVVNLNSNHVLFSMKHILFILGMVICNMLNGQANSEYSKLISEADSFYQLNNFKESALKYSQAFTVFGQETRILDKYNAACSWALAKEIDSSLNLLFDIAKNRGYASYFHIQSDSDLTSLHSDERWKELLVLVKENYDISQSKLDKTLVAILDTVLQADQGLRKNYLDTIQKYGRDSKEYKMYLQYLAYCDSINLVKVRKILDERGWLGADTIGEKGNMTLFLVIQHADLSTQEAYLPMMKNAVKIGNANPSSLALLEDRIALRKGEKQIYGSQIGRNPKTGEYYVSPLIDPDNVDKRRAEVGLGPLQEYVAKWNIVWDIAEYKKELPSLEQLRTK